MYREKDSSKQMGGLRKLRNPVSSLGVLKLLKFFFPNLGSVSLKKDRMVGWPRTVV